MLRYKISRFKKFAKENGIKFSFRQGDESSFRKITFDYQSKAF